MSALQRRGRCAALLAGAGLLLVVTLWFVFWKDVAVHYHLYRLRDPSGQAAYFLESVTKNEKSPKFLALLRFVERAEGKKVLAKAFVVEAWNTLGDQIAHPDRMLKVPHYEGELGDAELGDANLDAIFTRAECSHRAVLGLVTLPNEGLVVYRHDCTDLTSISPVSAGHRLQRLNALLEEASGEVFAFEGHPDLRFTIFAEERIQETSSFDWPFDNVAPSGQACMLTRVSLKQP